MDQKDNGNPVKLPTLIVEWDQELQGVKLNFKPEEFRSWEFVQAVLNMALEQAKFKGTLARAQQMQAAQQEAMQAQAVRQRLKL